MSISRSLATIAFSALPAGPTSLVRTFSSIVSEIVVSCCCALLPKKMIELESVTSSSLQCLLHLLLDRPIQLDLQVAGNSCSNTASWLASGSISERRHRDRGCRCWFPGPWRSLPRADSWRRRAQCTPSRLSWVSRTSICTSRSSLSSCLSTSSCSANTCSMVVSTRRKFSTAQFRRGHAAGPRIS